MAASGLPFGYTLVLAALVLVATLYGLLVGDAYRSVPGLLRTTWRAQDAVTLVLLPLLLVVARRARGGSLIAHLTWVGLLTWLTYGYAHYVVGVPFNAMFLVYVAITGLAGYGMLDGLLRVDVGAVASAFRFVPYRALAIFLTVAGVGMAGLWLSDIAPGVVAGLPRELHLAELPNPTWVFDLIWIIPLALAVARMLWRWHPAAFPMAWPLLVMLLALSVTMLMIVPLAAAAELHRSSEVAVQLIVFSVVFTVLGAFETWLLVLIRRRMGVAPERWGRAGWWS